MDIFSLEGKIAVNYGDAVKGIDEVISKAQGLGSSLGKAMQDAGGKISSVGDKISSAGKSLAPVSVAVGGVATAALKTSIDFDAAMSQVKAVSGATGDDFQALRDKAIEMGGKTKFSASEAAEAFNYMAMAGWETSDMLSGIEGIMNLAAASGENLGTTSDIVTDALTAFGLSAKDSGHFADVLAAAATSANTDVGKMGETFKYAAPVMGALGYSAEDTSLAIGLMGDSSIKAGMAGTVLRSSFARLTNPTEAMIEDMLRLNLATQEQGVDQEKLEKAQRKVEKSTLNVEKAQVSYNQAVAKYGAESPQAQKALLGVQQKSIDLEQAQSDLEKVQNTLIGTGEVHNLILNDEEGNARSLRDVMIFLRESLGGLDEQQQAAAVSAVFGTEAMSGMLAIINASDEDFNKLASAIDNCDGSAQDISDTMQDNLAGDLTELGSMLGVLAISIVDLFTPALRGIAEHAQACVNWLIGLDDGTKAMIGTVALVIAGLSPVLVTGGKIISGIGKIVGAVGKVITIVPKIAGAVSSVVGFITSTVIPFIGTIVSGIGTVISTIAAVVSSIGLVPIAIAAVIGVIVLLWNKCDWFREGVIAIWEAIKSAAIAVWNAIKDFMVNLWEGIVQAAETIFNGLASFFSACWEGMKNVFITVWTAISTFFSTIWEGIKNVVTVIVGAIQIFITNAWNTIKTVITTILTAIQTVFSTVWNAIKTVVTTVITAIRNFITTAWNAIKSTISNVLNAIKNTVSTIWNAIKSTITTVLNGIKSTISTVWNAIKTVITNVMNAIKTTITTVMNAIKATISNVWNGIKSVVTSAINAIKSVITNVFNAIKTTITNVLNAIKNTITTVWNAIKTTINTVLNGIKSTISTVWEAIKSTVSTVMDAIKTAISTAWEAIKSVVTTVVGAIQDFLTSAWDTIKSVITTVMDTIKSAFIDGWNAIKSAITDAIEGVKSAISNGLNAAQNVVSGVLGAIQSTFSSVFENAKNIVKNAVERIKGFFNFDWSLPRIKLPHFSISGKFSLDPPSIPRIGVEWYAKAMEGGMIMNQPTIFGYNPKTSQLMAGGETGSETVVGTESLMNMIKSAVASENGELIEVLKQILNAIISLDDGLVEKFSNALSSMRFQINEREFARLVKAV